MCSNFKNLINIQEMHKMKFPMNSLTFSYFICALNLCFAQGLRRKVNLACSTLLEPQNVLPNEKSCLKVAKHNWDRRFGDCQ